MTTATAALPVRDPIDYPDSDGKPVGETARHVNTFCSALEHVKRFFAGDPLAYVGGNMFLYFVHGDPTQNVCPDLFVVKGVPKVREPERRSYRTWEENGKGPDLVIEFTSKSTRGEDTGAKMELYRDVLKVKEYFLFDPFAEYLRPPFQGYRLTRGRYVPIKPVRGRLPSRVLGLHLENGGDVLRFWNPATKLYLPTPAEIEAEAQRETKERRRAERARRRAEAAQRRAEAALLKEVEDRERAEAAQLKEAEDRKRAEAAHLKEAEDRKRAEAENERLRRELDELRRGPSS